MADAHVPKAWASWEQESGKSVEMCGKVGCGIFTKGFKEVDNLEFLWFLGSFSGSTLLIGTGDFNQQMMMHGNNFLGRE